MPVQCTYCGADLKPQSRFCLNCGQLVAAATPEVAPAQTDVPPVVAAARTAGDATPAAPGMPHLAAAPPAQAPTPTPAAPPVSYTVRLGFADGSGSVLNGDAVLGRKPESAAAAEGLTAVALRDPLKSSSRVHLRIHLTAQGVNVVDAESGNGTRVEHEGTFYDCVPNQPFWIEPGDRLWLGDVAVDVTLG